MSLIAVVGGSLLSAVVVRYRNYVDAGQNPLKRRIKSE